MSRVIQDKRQRVDIRYRVVPMRDGCPAGDGDPVTDLQIQRCTTTYPKTAAGGIQWLKGEDYEGAPFSVPVGEVGLLVGELTDWLGSLLMDAQQRS